LEVFHRNGFKVIVNKTKYPNQISFCYPVESCIKVRKSNICKQDTTGYLPEFFKKSFLKKNGAVYYSKKGVQK